MKIKQINLQSERAEYSKKLQHFESQFVYPLGDKTFTIMHGAVSDYFTFFEHLGEVHYFVMEENEEIIGAFCAVLRDTWYLCDFKIHPDYRGKKLYLKLMRKYFFKLYFKKNTMFAINMSPTKDNKLVKHTQKILRFLAINNEAKYLSQFTMQELKEKSAVLDPDFWDNHYIVTNNGHKDIVVDGQSMPLYHIVNKIQKLHGKVDFNSIPDNSQVMYLNQHKLGVFADEIEITMIRRGNQGKYISSAEI
jgi:Fe-S cluster biosynthesis and repair protein YggX